jgi:ABC-type Na+ efflux pump permease subunit
MINMDEDSMYILIFSAISFILGIVATFFTLKDFPPYVNILAMILAIYFFAVFGVLLYFAIKDS